MDLALWNAILDTAHVPLDSPLDVCALLQSDNIPVSGSKSRRSLSACPPIATCIAADMRESRRGGSPKPVPRGI
jgi:hypothetical protein